MNARQRRRVPLVDRSPTNLSQNVHQLAILRDRAGSGGNSTSENRGQAIVEVHNVQKSSGGLKIEP